MPNFPFDRTIVQVREKPLSSDIDQLQSDVDRSIRFFASRLFADNATGNPVNGFIKNGFKVVQNSPTGMSVVVSSGLGFQNLAADVPAGIDAGNGPVTGLNDLEAYKPIVLTGTHTFSVPTAPVGPNTRIDIIEVRADRFITNSTSRQILDTGTGQFAPQTINKTLQFAVDARTGVVTSPASSTAPLSYKTGVAGNPGVAPATTAGYVKLCEIAVGSGVVTIVNANITDFRTKVGSGPDTPGSLSLVTINNLGDQGTTRDPVVDTLTTTSHITLGGSGELKHGDIEAWIPCNFITRGAGGEFTSQISSGNIYFENTIAGIIALAIPLKVGDRLKEVVVHCFDNSTVVIQFRLYKQVFSGAPPGTVTQLGSLVSSVNSANIQQLSIAGLTELQTNDLNFRAQISAVSASSGAFIYGVSYVYDRP